MRLVTYIVVLSLSTIGCQRPNATKTAVLSIELHEGDRFERAHIIQQSQIQLVGSPYLINQVLRLPEISSCTLVRSLDKPYRWLRKNLMVESSNTFGIYISLNSPQFPDDAKSIVNAVAEMAVKEFEAGHRAQMSDELITIRQRHRDITTMLEALPLASFQQRTAFHEELRKLEREIGEHET